MRRVCDRGAVNWQALSVALTLRETNELEM